MQPRANGYIGGESQVNDVPLWIVRGDTGELAVLPTAGRDGSNGPPVAGWLADLVTAAVAQRIADHEARQR